MAGQLGETRCTKVLIGGLAWETQKETMKNYFVQFGDILEAVVIIDKASGRSKGYGFVTFREPEAAMRACLDATPVIDGRRANCNLASLSVQRSKPFNPNHGDRSEVMMMNHLSTIGAGRKMRIQSGYGSSAFASPPTFPPYTLQHPSLSTFSGSLPTLQITPILRACTACGSGRQNGRVMTTVAAASSFYPNTAVTCSPSLSLLSLSSSIHPSSIRRDPGSAASLHSSPLRQMSSTNDTVASYHLPVSTHTFSHALPASHLWHLGLSFAPTHPAPAPHLGFISPSCIFLNDRLLSRHTSQAHHYSTTSKLMHVSTKLVQAVSFSSFSLSAMLNASRQSLYGF